MRLLQNITANVCMVNHVLTTLELFEGPRHLDKLYTGASQLAPGCVSWLPLIALLTLHHALIRLLK